MLRKARQPDNRPSPGRRAGVLLALLALTVTGCPTEVPYQAPEDDSAAETTEAPAFDSAEAEAESNTTDADSGTATPDTETEAVDAAEEPVDRYAAAPKTPPNRMPWESASDDSAKDEVPDMFAGTEPADPSGRYADTSEAEPEAEDEEESYADFLGDAYAGLLGDEPKEEAEPEEPKPATKEPPPAAELPNVPPNLVAKGDPSGLPFDVPEDLSFEPDDFDFEPKPKPKPKTPAKPPTTTRPSDAEELEDLWADVTPAPSDAPPAAERPEPLPAFEPEPDPEAEIADASGLHFGDPDVEDLFTEEVAPPAEEVAPAPEPAFEPVPEPKPEPAPPAVQPTPRRPAPRPSRPRATPGVEPLPSVPVLPFNTRHLAWLLGGKFALAELADLEGATPSEIADWNAEVERLARELKIRNPIVTPRPSDPAARVKAMMDAASRAGGELSRAYGPDHSALLEIAVKSNTLLIVAADRPDLAAPVADAVRAAADDAMLPRFLWGEAVRTLSERPNSEATSDAVERLHERVESFLR